MRDYVAGDVRVLKADDNFEDWCAPEEARLKVNTGLYEQVCNPRTGRFFGIKPAPKVYKPSQPSSPVVSVREMEINAGLYPGHLHKGQSHTDIPVSKGYLNSVRQKVKAFRGMRQGHPKLLRTNKYLQSKLATA